MISSWCFHKILFAFDEYCILNADIKFIEKPTPSEISTAFASSSSSSLITNEGSNSILTQPYALKNTNIETDEKTFLDTRKLSRNMILILLTFFYADKIDEQLSNYGDVNFCDWGIYLPIFECCFGIIMTSFFIICGKGGKANENAFLIKPWRIVMPALMFFLVMFFISIAKILLVHKGLKVFCDNLTENIPTISCYDAMNAFAVLSIDYEPNDYLIALYVMDWVIFSLWLFLAIIMLIRIIFVIDFQLVRVSIKTCEFENTNVHERSAFKVVEQPNFNLKNFDEAVVDVKYEELEQDTNLNDSITNDSSYDKDDNKEREIDNRK